MFYCICKLMSVKNTGIPPPDAVFIILTLFLGSSVVEQATVNRLAVGSNPTRGAILYKRPRSGSQKTLFLSLPIIYSEEIKVQPGDMVAPLIFMPDEKRPGVSLSLVPDQGPYL